MSNWTKFLNGIASLFCIALAGAAFQYSIGSVLESRLLSYTETFTSTGVVMVGLLGTFFFWNQARATFVSKKAKIWATCIIAFVGLAIFTTGAGIDPYAVLLYGSCVAFFFAVLVSMVAAAILSGRSWRDRH